MVCTKLGDTLNLQEYAGFFGDNEDQMAKVIKKVEKLKPQETIYWMNICRMFQKTSFPTVRCFTDQMHLLKCAAVNLFVNSFKFTEMELNIYHRFNLIAKTE